MTAAQMRLLMTPVQGFEEANDLDVAVLDYAVSEQRYLVTENRAISGNDRGSLVPRIPQSSLE